MDETTAPLPATDRAASALLLRPDLGGRCLRAAGRCASAAAGALTLSALMAGVCWATWQFLPSPAATAASHGKPGIAATARCDGACDEARSQRPASDS